MKKKAWSFLIGTILLLVFIPPVFPAPIDNPDESEDAKTQFFGFGGTKVTIMRDDYGVPHVFSSTKEGLAYGCGYAMAQDRLWQADLYRRQGYGSLAEFGLASINQDFYTRSMAYSKEELREIFDNWVPADPYAKLKEMMEAYVDGINLYIEEALIAAAGGDLSMIPIEYLPGAVTPQGLPLEPWTIEDSVAIVVMMAWRFGGTGGGELQYASALQALQSEYGNDVGWDMFNDLFPQNDPGAEVTVPHEEAVWPEVWSINDWNPSMTSGYSDSIEKLYSEYQEKQMGLTKLYESMGLPTKFGSNALIVAPKNSESGNAMQLGGPQMGQSIPQIVLEVGLHGPGIDAVGMMMPHAPSILIGASTYGAWTSTTGSSDVMDTYVEVLNPDNPYQYWHNGGWVDMEKRTERFYGYLKQTYEERDIYRTVHGPIAGWDLDNYLAFTMKADYYKDELAAEEGWSLFQQANSLADFHEACKLVTPNHNFFLADNEGNIGYWHSGAFPVKPATGKDGRPIDDRLPLWGTGEEEWVRVTGPSEMPVCINPEQGYLANWNNKPIANWPYGESDTGWGEGHRVSEIMDTMDYLLATKGKINLNDVNIVNQRAGYHHNIGGINSKIIFDHFLTAAEIGALTDPEIALVLPYLQSWNLYHNDLVAPQYPSPDGTYDDPGLTIFADWFYRVRSEVFADDLPPALGSARGSALIHVFDGAGSTLPLNYDYLNGEDKNDVLIRTLKWTIGNLTADLGPDIATWLTPVRLWWPSQLGALPRAPMHFMNRGTYNQLVDMPQDWSRWATSSHAWNVIPPGQSGFMNGYFEYNHAYDQLPLYETWTYKPMRYRFWEIWQIKESIKYLYY
jgi:penicillin amidase